LYGILAVYIFPTMHLDPAIFALVGMAAMVGGTTGAFVTAILMLFEITGDYNTLLPSMIAVSIADNMRKYLSPETIYTLKVKRRGFALPKGLQSERIFEVKRNYPMGDGNDAR
jgi:CIC family chloride channel protein